ncbi:MAG: ABC transporter permease [Trueperaceae bacterium]|nr:ABC transporter permease [Trueperaceae bacterium]
MAVASRNTPGQAAGKSKKRSQGSRAWRRFTANRMAVAGLVVVILLVLMAIFANVLAPYDPINEIFRGKRGVGPEAGHLLGYDHIGRDLLSRIIYGSRIALIVGLVSTTIAVIIGVIVGAVAGYFGGWVDEILSLLIDTLMAFPLLALLIVLSAVVSQNFPEASLFVTIVVIGMTVWARYARVVRAEVMSVRERDYVTAARALGSGDGRIIWRHVIPNILSSVIILASLQIGSIIILESALSFLGLGVRPPTPTWGGTLADGRILLLRAPHISAFPGLMIVITVLAFNFVGDGLRDALDPHEKDY